MGKVGPKLKELSNRLPSISKTATAMNIKFCMALETSLSIVEMLKLLT